MFYIPIFMGYPCIVPCGLHAVVGHECVIACSPVLLSGLAEPSDSSAQVISSMKLRHTSSLPQCFFDPLCQCLERFAEADADCFHVLKVNSFGSSPI
jgi:hypothetical protein